MEFFKIIEAKTSEKEIWGKIDIQHLEEYCSSLFPLEKGKSESLVGGIWGEFRLRRDEIKGGVRFSLNKDFKTSYFSILRVCQKSF